MADKHLLPIRGDFTRDKAVLSLHLQNWSAPEMRQATASGQRKVLRLCLPASLGLELSLVALKNQEGEWRGPPSQTANVGRKDCSFERLFSIDDAVNSPFSSNFFLP